MGKRPRDGIVCLVCLGLLSRLQAGMLDASFTRERMMELQSIISGFLKLGLAVPRVVLPREGVDLTKWAVIACDQFTSDAGYWQRVDEAVGDSPSALRLIVPERYLEEPDVDARAARVLDSMNRYLAEGILQEQDEGFVVVKREMESGATRTGLLAALDLERYDFSAGSATLIRATEGTIPERIPPRTRIRRGASLELPHVLVLYDDPQNHFGGLVDDPRRMRPLYDFELMERGGRISGRLAQDPRLLENLLRALENLADRDSFKRRYGSDELLLFAVGDGNHSLAAAKTVWEETKRTVGPSNAADHPGRYALVELVNIHDHGIHFEPIHRVLFGGAQAWERRVSSDSRIRMRSLADRDALIETVNRSGSRQSIGMVTERGFSLLELTHPISKLPTASLQAELDDFLRTEHAVKIDYIHGDESAVRLGMRPGNVAFLLPAISKTSFFQTIIQDGSLPRKTFSMGEAEEKRYYLEARRIVPV